MDVLYISEADTVRDIASLLDKVRSGTEIVIENGDSTFAVLSPPGSRLDGEEPQPRYDEWFRAEVHRALDDPRPPIDGEIVEAYFAEKRPAVLATIQDRTD